MSAEWPLRWQCQPRLLSPCRGFEYETPREARVATLRALCARTHTLIVGNREDPGHACHQSDVALMWMRDVQPLWVIGRALLPKGLLPSLRSAELAIGADSWELPPSVWPLLTALTLKVGAANVNESVGMLQLAESALAVQRPRLSIVFWGTAQCLETLTTKLGRLPAAGEQPLSIAHMTVHSEWQWGRSPCDFRPDYRTWDRAMMCGCGCGAADATAGVWAITSLARLTHRCGR
jgi:hypothetical protein